MKGVELVLRVHLDSSDRRLECRERELRIDLVEEAVELGIDLSAFFLARRVVFYTVLPPSTSLLRPDVYAEFSF